MSMCVQARHFLVSLHAHSSTPGLPSAADRVTLLAPEMLHVGSASDDDTGKYTCTVSNEYGSETRSFYLGLMTGVMLAAVIWCT